MMEIILFFANATLLILFGVYLSAALAGIRFTVKNILVCLATCAFSGGLQIFTYVCYGEDIVWKLYPLISHLPLFLVLVGGYRKRIATALASICTAYLCCQPAKWIGLLVLSMTASTTVQYLARICVLILAFLFILLYLASYMSEIFNKDTRSVCIFGITPFVYYIFDYAAVIYTDFWTAHINIAAEFLSFFLGIVFLTFCFVYYREYEQKADALRKEQIIRLTVEEQKKELDAVKRSEHEIRLLRHDMRLLLFNLSTCIDNDDKETAKKMISSYVNSVDATAVKKYCENTTINYIISAFAERCKEMQTELACQIDIDVLGCDEIMLSTILSNALDNAINAQQSLPTEERKINLMLKNFNGKLLLSIKNPFLHKPVFANGIPISSKKGHGYGSQSIVYLTERLGGSCQFTTDGNLFVLRVVI